AVRRVRVEQIAERIVRDRRGDEQHAGRALLLQLELAQIPRRLEEHVDAYLPGGAGQPGVAVVVDVNNRQETWQAGEVEVVQRGRARRNAVVIGEACPEARDRTAAFEAEVRRGVGEYGLEDDERAPVVPGSAEHHPVLAAVRAGGRGEIEAIVQADEAVV